MTVREVAVAAAVAVATQIQYLNKTMMTIFKKRILMLMPNTIEL